MNWRFQSLIIHHYRRGADNPLEVSRFRFQKTPLLVQKVNFGPLFYDRH